MPRKYITLLIASGPEVRAFIHSRLCSELSRDYEVNFIASQRGSAAFSNIPAERVCELPASQEPPGLARLRGWTRESKIAWLQTQGITKWRHYFPTTARSGPPRAKFSPWLKSRPATAKTLSVIERALGSLTGTCTLWQSLFHQLRTDCLVSAGFSSACAISGLQTATNLGIKTLVATNSWKDVYVCPHVPVPPDRLIVWNSRAKLDLLIANPNLSSDRILVSSSLHLQPFLGDREILNRSAFCSLMGLDPQRPYIAYTAAAPAAVQEEERIVEALLQAIVSGALPRETQILLRLNPMENGSRFFGLENHYASLRIQKPLWEWDAKADWCCALGDDIRIWVATVFHSAMNVSIASTTTLEFSAFGRPVVNVCFDICPNTPSNRSNKRFWDADFYADVRETGIAVPAFSLEALIEEVKNILTRNEPEAVPQTKEPTNNDPVSGLLRVFHELIT